jgi:hypothetical protein
VVQVPSILGSRALNASESFIAYRIEKLGIREVNYETGLDMNRHPCVGLLMLSRLIVSAAQSKPSKVAGVPERRANRAL